MATASWLGRMMETLAPQWRLRRLRAQLSAELMQRHYEAASVGRRSQGWRRSLADANAATGPFVGRLRDIARDLVRNNPYAESALATIVDHTVGWGIVAKPMPKHAAALAQWQAWAETTACDADGRHDFAGLQQLTMRTVAESGEALVRRRLRRPDDGLPIPLQIQVLEPDFLDTAKEGPIATGGRILHGVELDPIGRRIAYWLFPEHPGSVGGTLGASVRVPAENVLHVFRGLRPGQLRGASWFAPVLLRFKDFDELEDATLMKQKIAACLSVITSDTDGTAPALGSTDPLHPEIDSLEPGMILNVPPGRTIEVVQPPAMNDYPKFSMEMLRSIATGLGVTYEDLTGDYTDLPFSAARMSRLRHWARVDEWRWQLIIPQFCDPVWAWAMEAAAIMGLRNPPSAVWTPPPMPMLEPDKEGLAYQRNIRTGITTLSESIRERGYEPDDVFAEMASDWKKLDALGLLLDCDPRKMTQAGQAQSAGAGASGGAAPVNAAAESLPEES
jgi:lambda family phage portal protein